jgi:hypothetical protein
MSVNPKRLQGALVSVPMTDAESVTPFELVAMKDFKEQGPQWIVQGLIESQSVTAVSGDPGGGKTFLLIDLGLHVAAGQPWFGHKVKSGAVLYIAAEAPESVKRRSKLATRIKFEGQDLPYRVQIEAALLGDDRWSENHTERVIATARAVEAELSLELVLIIIDTVAASMGSGNENLDGMQRLTSVSNRIATETQCAVILNHHPNRAGDALRGHGSLRGTISHGFEIVTMGETRVLNAIKQRDARTGRLLAYTLEVHTLLGKDNFGDAATSCVVMPAEVPDESTNDSKIAGTTLKALSALKLAQSTKARRPDNADLIGIPTGIRPVTTLAWVDTYLESNPAPNLKDPRAAARKACDRARRDLEAEGLIGHVKGYVWLV